MGKPERVAASIAACAMVFGMSGGSRATAATTYTVDKTVPCSDNGPGNESNPFCSIGKAAVVASAGDIVVVRAGTYNETVNPAKSGSANNPITFRSGGAVVITGATRGFLVRRNHIVIDGFEVTNTSSHGIYVNGGSFVTVRNTYVHDVGRPVDGESAKGIYLKDAADSTVQNNVVERATDAGIAVLGSSVRVVVRANTSNANARGYARAAVGIDIRNSSTVTVDNNRLMGNEDSGINIWDSSNVIVRGNVAGRNGDHGIDNKTSTGTAIDGNTIFGGVDSGIEVVGNATGVTVTNNISADNGINSPRTTGNVRVDATAASTVQLNYNVVFLSQPGDMIVWGSDRYATLPPFVTATGQMANGRSGDPLFVSAAANDFHLQRGSPAIDAADANAPSHAPVDSEGSARFDDPSVSDSGVGVRTFDDIGAFEYQGASDQPPVAVNDTATVNEDASATALGVLGNDTDPDGGPMSVASVTQPANGTAAVVAGGGDVTYAPSPNYCNTGGTSDSFTYTLAPGGSSATVTVTVTCQDDPPVAIADSASVPQDSAAGGIDVLANDTDVDGGSKAVASITQPGNGTAAIVAGGASVTYTPAAGYCNDGNPVDTFTYTLTPGGSTATVSVTVPCATPPPPIELLPSGDATLRQSRPGSTNGSGTVLSVDGDPVKDVLMKFDVSGIGGRTVTRAVIRLWCVDSSGTGGKFHTVAHSNWNENTVTWGNAPAFDPTPFRSMGPVETGKFHELDVTDIVRADGSYSFRVDLISIYDAGYSSKEEPDASKRPKLIISI